MSGQFKVPTRRIKLKDGGSEQIINVEDFDPEIHEPVELERKKLAKPIVEEDDEEDDEDEAPAKSAARKK